MENEAKEIQERYTYRSPKEGLILDYVERKVPIGWNDMSCYERIAWMEDEDNVGTEERTRICALELWCELFNGGKGTMSNADARELNGILSRLKGWIKLPNPVRINDEYGRQRAYKRLTTK